MFFFSFWILFPTLNNEREIFFLLFPKVTERCEKAIFILIQFDFYSFGKMGHQHDAHCKCKATVAAQSLDEMDFERGIWSAGMLLNEQ